MSKIEWTDYTLNFWKGCDKVSAGCDNCYMYRQAKQYGWDPTAVTRCGKAIWRQPQVKCPSGRSVYKWRDGSKVFICSWSDFFHRTADQWREDAWAVISGRPGLTWILTTKRIERAAECLPEDFSREKYPNIIFMPTCENQEMANERIPPALELKAKYPWIRIAVSVEPMLGPVDLDMCPTVDEIVFDDKGEIDESFPVGCMPCRSGKHWEYLGQNQNCGLDWVICGGESGPGARPMHPDWARGVRDQCKAAGVPFFFKQWGEWLPLGQAGSAAGSWIDNSRKTKNGEAIYRVTDGYNNLIGTGISHHFENPCQTVWRIGKKKAGCLLDGVEHKEYPNE